MKNTLGKRKLIAIGLVFLLLVCIAVFAYFYFSKFSDDNTVEARAYSTCDDDYFYKVVVDEQVYLSKNFAELNPLVEEIKKTEGYEDSPNCMFLLTMQAINTSNREEAPVYFEKLNEAFIEKKSYTGTLELAGLQEPEDIKPTIEFLKSDKSINGSVYEWSEEAL